MRELVEFFVVNLPIFLSGLVVTLELTLIGLGIGMTIGLPTALAKVYGKPWVRWLANAYTDVFRGTPLLVQLFVIYYGLPEFGITFSRLTAAFVAIGLNSGAYQSEYFRGAIQAIGSGQMVAARSIGMSRLKAVRYIILPQAMRIIIPPWSNEPISLLKASAVAYLIALPDMMAKAKALVARTYDPIPAYLGVAFIYLILVLAMSLGLNMLETRLKIPGMQIEGKYHRG